MESPDLQELLLALKQPEKDVYEPAIQALIVAGKIAVPLLLTALDAEDERQVQIRIRGILNRIARTMTLESTVQMLLFEDDPRIREWTALNIRYVQCEQVVEPLITALADPDLLVREAVIYALGYLGDTRAVEPILAVLQGNEQSLKPSAVQALGDLEDIRALAPLLEALKDPDPQLRKAVCKALGDLKSQEVTRPLLDMLKTETDLNVRATIIQSLEFLKDRSGVPVLLNYLSDTNRDVRLQTISTLGKLKDSRAINPLLEILKNDEDNLVRAYAAAFLGDFEGQAEVIKPLIGALEDRDGYVRMNAVESLTRLKISEALEAIMPLLDDKTPAVRWVVCRYLEKFGDERVLPTLEHLGRKDDGAFRKRHTVKEAAQAAIKAIRERTEME